MARFTISLFLSFAIFTGWAQKEPVKFGKVDVSDVKMTTYEKDSTAEAVILGDFGQSTLVYNNSKGWVITFDRICRIKILKNNGLKYANYSFDLIKSGNGNETLGKLKACTYNWVNGKIEKFPMAQNAIYYEEGDKYSTRVKFTLPNVQVGRVIEFTCSIISDLLFLNYPWTFQHKIPAVFSEYRLEYPQYFSYKFLLKGYLPFDVNEHKTEPRNLVNLGGTDRLDYTAEIYRMVIRDVPAFHEEPYMNAPENYQVVSLPDKMNLMLPDNAGSFAFKCLMAGPTLQLMIDFQINKPLFSGTEYKNLQEFYKSIVAKEAEQVVLKQL